VGLLVISIAVGVYFPLRIVLIPFLIGTGVALAGIVVAFIGLIITAPRNKKRRQEEGEDELRQRDQHF
jgi:hypothetical protein